MARRVKKTDSREVDHWVSTDDGRHLPIDKDGNIIFGSSKKSTYKKNLNGTYQRKEKHDGVLVQATVIPGRDKGKDFYTIKTGIGDDFESSDERYSTLSSAKNAADKALENRLNSKEDTSKSDSNKKKAIDEDKLYEIADRYNSSEPVSGDWNTELDHEIATIQKEFGLSKSEAKDAMKKYLGFTDDDFADDEPELNSKELRKVLNKNGVDAKRENAKMLSSSDMRSKAIDSLELRDILHVDTADADNFRAYTIEKWKDGEYLLEDDKEEIIYTGNSKQIKEKLESLLKAKKLPVTQANITQPNKNYQSKDISFTEIYNQERAKYLEPYKQEDLGSSSDKPKSVAPAKKPIQITDKQKRTAQYIVRDKITPEVTESKKRSSAATSAKKPTRKTTTSSKTNKIRQLMGNDKDMVEWKINRAYDKTSLKELALDAGVPSSKIRTMSTEELRAMLLSMWKGK